MALESSQAGRLEEARFLAIVRDSFGIDLSGAEAPAVQRFPFGVAAIEGVRAWVVSSASDPSVLGGILLWAARSPADQIDVVVAHHAGMHARRLALLAPEMTAWLLDGTRVVEATPEPMARQRPPSSGLESFEALIESAGATVCHEEGILRAEVRGLEVGRVVDGASGPEFEGGVGRFDREAGALLHGQRDPGDALAAVVAQVVPHRVAGAPSHPAGRLARARWLRSLVIENPALAGLDDAEAVDPIVPRVSLLDDVPAAVIGHSGGRRVVAICGVGVDLGLVPEAADQVQRHGPDEVRIVVSPRDRLTALVELCERLPVPVSFVDIDPPWSSGGE